MRLEECYLGDRVIWQRELRGGYGYVENVPAEIVGVTAKRVKIACDSIPAGSRLPARQSAAGVARQIWCSRDTSESVSALPREGKQ